jgi:entericidin B
MALSLRGNKWQPRIPWALDLICLIINNKAPLARRMHYTAALAARQMGCGAKNFSKETSMKKLAALLALLYIGALAGCNTFEGMGKDIERGGEKVQDGSKSTKEKM